MRIKASPHEFLYPSWVSPVSPVASDHEINGTGSTAEVLLIPVGLFFAEVAVCVRTILKSRQETANGSCLRMGPSDPRVRSFF